jgi:hypothetical protein
MKKLSSKNAFISFSRKSLLLILFTGVITSCSILPSGTEGAADDEAETLQEQPTPEDDSQQAQPEIEVVECSQVIQGGIERTINAQTASFAVDDFELAYSYASESFRSSVSLERFIDIIQGSYGPLISSSQLSFDNCLFYPEAPLATIDVRFTEAGTEVYALRYVMVESDLGWRVDGAGGLASIGSGT